MGELLRRTLPTFLLASLSFPGPLALARADQGGASGVGDAEQRMADLLGLITKLPTVRRGKGRSSSKFYVTKSAPDAERLQAAGESALVSVEALLGEVAGAASGDEQDDAERSKLLLKLHRQISRVVQGARVIQRLGLEDSPIVAMETALEGSVRIGRTQYPVPSTETLFRLRLPYKIIGESAIDQTEAACWPSSVEKMETTKYAAYPERYASLAPYLRVVRSTIVPSVVTSGHEVIPEEVTLLGDDADSTADLYDLPIAGEPELDEVRTWKPDEPTLPRLKTIIRPFDPESATGPASTVESPTPKARPDTGGDVAPGTDSGQPDPAQSVRSGSVPSGSSPGIDTKPPRELDVPELLSRARFVAAFERQRIELSVLNCAVVANVFLLTPLLDPVNKALDLQEEARAERAAAIIVEHREQIAQIPFFLYASPKLAKRIGRVPAGASVLITSGLDADERGTALFDDLIGAKVDGVGEGFFPLEGHWRWKVGGKQRTGPKMWVIGEERVPDTAGQLTRLANLVDDFAIRSLRLRTLGKRGASPEALEEVEADAAEVLDEACLQKSYLLAAYGKKGSKKLVKRYRKLAKSRHRPKALVKIGLKRVISSKGCGLP